MTVDVVELTKELCSIPSISGDEGAAGDAMASHLQALGFDVKRQSLGHRRDNILALPQKTPRIILSTHIDTVPPYIAPREEDGWLYGRGVIDAKGIAAAMMGAADALLNDNIDDVGLLFVVGEETDSDGARAAVHDFLPKVDYIINGEPTELKLTSGMKGVIVFDLETTGKAGHSAYAESGFSAVHQLLEDCGRLVQHPWPNDPVFGKTTINIGTFDGGVAANVWAPSAKAQCIMRTTIDADVLETEFRKLLSPSTTVTIRSKNGPQKLHTLPGFETGVVAFGSDVPYLRVQGAPLLFGPGSILDAHTSRERVKIADLLSARDTYISFARALRAQGTAP